MGAYLSKPKTEKETEEGDGNGLMYGASCMQGWRVSQEDAHNCITSLDEKSSLFAVYDGHGGSEVAIYLSRHFPEYLKQTEAYKNGQWEKALHDAFVGIDGQIKSYEAITEIQKIAKNGADTDEEDKIADYDEENVAELYEEASMPIQALLEKYNASAATPGEVAAADFATRACNMLLSSMKGESSSSADRPGSSKNLSRRPTATNEAGASSSSSCSMSVSSKVTVESEVCDSDEMPSTSVKTSVCVQQTMEVEGDSECSSSSKSVSVTAMNVNLDDTAEAEVKGGASPESDPVVKENGNGDVEPSSSTNEAEQEECVTEGNAPSTVKVNGVDESTNQEPDSTEADSSVTPSSNIPNGRSGSDSSAKSNGEADSTQADNVVKITIESPKRKGKVHPPPVVRPAPAPTRSSKRINDSKVYENFLKDESATSDSDDEEAVEGQAFAHDTDSDDDDEPAGANSSSTDEDDEDMEEEEDDDSEDLDDEEEEEADSRILNDIQEPGYDSGSTAVVAFFRRENDKLHLYVANAGDSRCVVSRQGTALDMSHDHKPEDETEARRIVRAGGKVTADGRVNGGLNLSRAIGDHSYKQNQMLPPEEQMITPVPDIKHEIIDPALDEFIILACDGVWNSMTSQEVVDFVSDHLKENMKLSGICEKLFDACLAHDTTGDGTGCDNMTAILIKLAPGNKVEVGSATVESSKRRLSTSEAEVAEDSKRLKADID